MSLIVAVYVPTGIVISGDSRTMVTRTVESTVEGRTSRETTPVVLSDATEKVLVLRDRFAVATWGDAFVGNLPIAHHIRTFDREAGAADSARSLAEGLLGFFGGMTPVPRTQLLVAAYRDGEQDVFSVDVPNGRVGVPNEDPEGRRAYGILRGGDTDIVDRLLSNEGLLPPFQLMNLQDGVDYSRHLIRTTIDEMRFEPKVPTVGGPIDTLVVRPDAAPEFLVHKALAP